MSKRRSRLEEPSAKLFFGEGRHSKSLRKDAQLCAQVAEALSLALAESADPSLDGLWVMEVEPAPHIGHLRVLIQAGPESDLRAIQTKLEARLSYLRRQVGEAIHRKKVPSLSFAVLPHDDGDEELDR
jgi:ribosome-binding factor A